MGTRWCEFPSNILDFIRFFLDNKIAASIQTSVDHVFVTYVTCRGEAKLLHHHMYQVPMSNEHKRLPSN